MLLALYLRIERVAHPIAFMMAIHSFDTATLHASPILAVMLSWNGTQCTTLTTLMNMLIIKDVGSGRPCVNRSSLRVK